MEDKDFINKEFPQNCGDSLLVLEKGKKSGFWICKFLKYPHIIEASKQKILLGNVNNPEIENQTFIGNIFFQKCCNDNLKVLKKTDLRKDKNILYECEFQKYPYKILARKDKILNGSVNNPQIEQVEFIDKIWPQNCGDDLRIVSKTDKYQNTSVLYECEFIKYPYKCLAQKIKIINGLVKNQNLPYLNKNNLIKYIQENFKDKKPTLTELAKSLNISSCTVGRQINEFNLRDYISYSYCGLEDEILKFFKDLNCKINKNIWIKECQKEIDIFIPKFNLGIEINGNYWHSELYKSQNYHQEKSLIFQEKGINLIHIFEYEWNQKQEIIKSLIKSKLGIFIKRIYARKCVIKELDYKTYAQFCNENHLQGECGAKVKLGLFYEGVLIQVMSFGVPRFTDKYKWEIIRECSKLGYIIIGGKEKLWSYFTKNYSPNNCLSYCDFSKFNGNSYLKLGFKKERLNSPGFVWWDQKLNQTYLRTPSKHQEFKEKYLKIYDCGQLVFVWEK